MKISKTKKNGFCMGVKRAYEMVKFHKDKLEKPIYILGDLVHNTHVIREVKEWGIKKVDNYKQVNAGTLIITAHGVSPTIIEKIKKKGVKILDTTCPKVSYVIKKAKDFRVQKRQILIFGDKNHKEVIAINGAIDNKGLTFLNKKELLNWEEKMKFGRGDSISLISQTTREGELFKKFKNYLKKKYDNFTYEDTICSATQERQREIRELANKYDKVLIIGSPSSSNSNELFKIANKINQETYFVDDVSELKTEWFKKDDKVIVCSGASIPAKVIERIVKKLHDMVMDRNQ